MPDSDYCCWCCVMVYKYLSDTPGGKFVEGSDGGWWLKVHEFICTKHKPAVKYKIDKGEICIYAHIFMSHKNVYMWINSYFINLCIKFYR